MTKAQARKARIIAILSLALVLTAFFIVRGVSKTTSLYDYALSLGSDELFAGEDCKLYRMSPPARQLRENQIFLHYENTIENAEFPHFFGKKPLSKLSPYEFAATYCDSELYIRGDGSIWTVAPRSSNKLDSFHVQPYFSEISDSPPTAEETFRITNLSIDYHLRLHFRLTHEELQNPYTALSVQLEDGNWYRLSTAGKFQPSSLPKNRYNGGITLPYNLNTIYTPTGRYCLAVYDTVDGEDILIASREFTLSQKGSDYRVTAGNDSFFATQEFEFDFD